MKTLSRGRRAVALALLLCLTGTTGSLREVTAQEDDGQADEESTQAVTPEPYTPEEFPGWARELRRGQIIALGVFPISLILTQLTYDLVRFGVESAQAGEFDRDAAPWFFAPPGVQRFSQEEKETILITSAVVSVVFALVDYALGRRERRRAENQ